MAKRTKELFELLNRDRGAAAASARRPQPAGSSIEAEPERSQSETGDTLEPRQAGGSRRSGFGGRKVPVSLNVLLLFIGAFVLTNVCSYIVGKGLSGRTEVPLTTEMRLSFVVSVAPKIAARHNFAAWALCDRLRDAGFEQADVLRIRKEEYLLIVAGRFTRDRRADCKKLESRVRDHFARLAPRKPEPNEFVIPTDIRTITISNTPYPQREPRRAP